jgi:V/A-type H+-transporting ATPase subunit F
VSFYFIGEEELLIALRFSGVSGMAVKEEKGALEAFRNIAVPHSPYKVLILTEQAAAWLGDTLTEWQLSGQYPLVVEIPGLGGHLPNAKSLVASIREAIGVQV